jgi:hypothetical protein
MGRLPADNNQPYGISSADSTQPLHALDRCRTVRKSLLQVRNVDTHPRVQKSCVSIRLMGPSLPAV